MSSGLPEQQAAVGASNRNDPSCRYDARPSTPSPGCPSPTPVFTLRVGPVVLRIVGSSTASPEPLSTRNSAISGFTPGTAMVPSMYGHLPRNLIGKTPPGPEYENSEGSTMVIFPAA